MNEWISLKDQEPPRGQPVLITDGKVIVVSFWQSKQGGGTIEVYRGPRPASPNDPPPGELIFSVPIVKYIWEGYGFGGPEWEWTFKDYEITHWMPLPGLPKKDMKSNKEHRGYGMWGKFHAFFGKSPRKIWIGPMSEKEMREYFDEFRHSFRSNRGGQTP